jgi:hypothetical protein
MNSITAAKNRRANGVQNAIPPQPPQQTMQQNNQKPVGITLPQVIQLVDYRLTQLEKTVGELKTSPNSDETKGVHFKNDDISEDLVKISEWKESVQEFDKRYEMLVEEIMNLKNIVLNLQSYTMDVNKLLMEERSRFFDEMEKKENNKQISTGEIEIQQFHNISNEINDT